MKIVLIRHGRTIGNVKGCFNGVTNDPLCTEGIETLNTYVSENIYPRVEAVISSPMKRCLQTSNIIYPQHKPIIVDKLKEINFGDFENKNHIELENNPDYIMWLKTNGKSNIPNGENLVDFSKRSLEGFYQGIDNIKNFSSAAFVIHGGTIMALLTELTGENFYKSVPKNGLGFVMKWDMGKVKDLEILE